MFVGYAENNSDGLGHMMNAKNQRIHITCDFMCLNQMYDSKAEYDPEEISTTIFTEKSEDNINEFREIKDMIMMLGKRFIMIELKILF